MRAMVEPAPAASSTRYCPLCSVRYESGDTCPEDGAVLVVEREADPLVGTVLADAYRLDELIGAGGMGRVYRGVQLSLQRPIAVKVLRSDRTADPAMVRRFLQEARLSSRLDHPNIVHVIDGGNTAAGCCYLVMELLEGMTLDAFVPEGGLSWTTTRELFTQLCAGVEALHRAGLVHRDLKPKNIMLRPRGDGGHALKILDFGLAKPLDPDSTGLTADGQFLGTPGYLAPEQMSSGEITIQTDVYALGAVLYFMLTKSPAFAGEAGPAIVVQQLDDETVELVIDHADAPPGLTAVIRKALRRAPHRRFTSVAELVAALRELDEAVEGPTLSSAPDERALRSSSRRRFLIGLGSVGALGASALTLWATRPRAPIRLGMSGALSGTAGAIGRDMALGLGLRFDQANAAGELPATIELEVLDDGYEPARAEANVARFGADKLALVGNIGTPTTAACLPALLAAKLPLIGAHSGAEHLRRDPPDRYVFNYRAGYALETAAIIEHVCGRERLEPSKIAVLAQADAYGESGVDGIRRALAARGFREFERVAITRYAPNTMAVRDSVETIAALPHVELVILIAAYRAAAQFVASLAPRRPELRYAGVSPTGSSAFADELIDLGHDPTGILLTQIVPHPDASANGVLRYRDAITSYAPDAVPGFISLEGYIVADLVVEALRRCERDYSRERLVDALEGFRAVDLGFGAPITFTPSDHQGSKRVWATRIDGEGELIEFALG